RRGIRLAALLTHPQSPKHLRLYEAFGFELGSTVAVMAKEVAAPGAAAAEVERLSALGATAREEALSGCRALTSSLYDGLDLGREIAALAAQRLGDVILLGSGRGAQEPGTVAGFAVCQHGAGTEAGSGTLFVKFAAVRRDAEKDFAALLERCERFAAALGTRRIVAGVNTGRRRAYRLMRGCGYRTFLTGVAMHRPDDPGYDRPEIFVVDDLR
ncbi:MAG: GNAT family N-acetyltransferase, partial [Alphaproteobacteria bacterium]